MSVATPKAPMVVKHLREEDHKRLIQLYKVWDGHLLNNEIKKMYYDGENALRDLGIAIPPELKNLRLVVGWPAKAVDALAVRSRFDGFVFESEADGAIKQVLSDNNFKSLYTQSVKSQLVHGCSFITVSKGSAGEPPVLISAYSAETAAAVWNNRKKRIDYGMTVVEVDKNKHPTWVNIYTDTHVIEIRRETQRIGAPQWEATYLPHALGRPLMEPLVHSPSLLQPLGKSRITRAVRSITDSAMRTALRTEVSAEFYTSPQKYLLGAPEGIFDDQSKWQAYVGNIFAIAADTDMPNPQFGQLPQMTLQPHLDYMRSLAAQFAGETSIPVSSLGIIHDNPSSAQAISAAREDLVIAAQDLNDDNGAALRNVGLMALAIMEDTNMESLPPEVRSITAKFRSPAMPSIVSQSDAMVKQVSAIPWIGMTTVALEELGYSEEQIMRMKAERRRAEGDIMLQMLMSKEAADAETEPADAEAL